MKKLFLVLIAVLATSLFVQPEDVSAGPCRNNRGGFGSGGGGFGRNNSGRRERVIIRRTVSRRSSSGGGWGFGGGSGGGAVETKPPVLVTVWTDSDLTKFGTQKFRELSKALDHDAENLEVVIAKKEYQTTKNVRTVEDVDFLAKWTVVKKTADGREEKEVRRVQFELKFDDYGNWTKLKE